MSKLIFAAIAAAGCLAASGAMAGPVQGAAAGAVGGAVVAGPVGLVVGGVGGAVLGSHHRRPVRRVSHARVVHHAAPTAASTPYRQPTR